MFIRSCLVSTHNCTCDENNKTYGDTTGPSVKKSQGQNKKLIKTADETTIYRINYDWMTVFTFSVISNISIFKTKHQKTLIEGIGIFSAEKKNKTKITVIRITINPSILLRASWKTDLFSR